MDRRRWSIKRLLGLPDLEEENPDPEPEVQPQSVTGVAAAIAAAAASTVTAAAIAAAAARTDTAPAIAAAASTVTAAAITAAAASTGTPAAIAAAVASTVTAAAIAAAATSTVSPVAIAAAAASTVIAAAIAVAAVSMVTASAFTVSSTRTVTPAAIAAAAASTDTAAAIAAAAASTDTLPDKRTSEKRSTAVCRSSTLEAQPQKAGDAGFAAIAAAPASTDTRPDKPPSAERSAAICQSRALVMRPSHCLHLDASTTAKPSYSRVTAGEGGIIGGVVGEIIGETSTIIQPRHATVTGPIGGVMVGPVGGIVGAVAAGLVEESVPFRRKSRSPDPDRRVLFEGYSGPAGISSSPIGTIVGASSGGIISKAADIAIPYTSPDESDFSIEDDRPDSPGPADSSATVEGPAERPFCLGPAPAGFRAPEDQAPGGSQPPARPASPVGTRARFTYGLDRFDKNAMLIFAQSSPQGRQYVEQRVDMLTRSFRQLRFEVEAHIDLGPKEMEACLENFFSRDRAGVGAVCVAAVGGAAEVGYLPARALRVPESRVLRWLTDQLPSALAGRPRIYITEVERSGVAADSRIYSLPITRSFPDVIGVHIPVIIEGEPNPLQMLCSRLGSERDFVAEVTAAVHSAETAFSILALRPIQVESTLLLDLELVKTKGESTASGQSESVPNGVNNTSEIVPHGVEPVLEDLLDVANIKLQKIQASTSGTSEITES